MKPKTDKESASVVSLYLQRSEKAIRETERLYGRLFLRIAANITADPGLAEEVVNDTYLALWNRIPPAQPESLQAYGSAVARNLAISRVRAERAGKRPQVLCELDEVFPDVSEKDPAGDTDLGEHLTRFLQAEDRLSRVVFVMRYFEEEPLDRIAERTGLSEGAVKSRLHRTRQKLRKYLEKRGIHV